MRSCFAEERLATASPDDVPKGGRAATSRHLQDRFNYYLRNQGELHTT